MRSLLFCFALVACDGVATPTVAIDQDFTLAPGDAASIQGTGTRIRFLGVEGDSRCPADALCIQGGDALVKVEAQSPGAQVRSYDLHTGSMAPVQHEGLTIFLIQLTPYPFSSRTIEPRQYRATLRVTNA